MRSLPAHGPSGHLWHAVGNCCIMCGTRIWQFEGGHLPICPGGPATNIRAITHKIAERRLSKAMQYDRPFRYPSA
jgi:hypothetical protein